MQSSMGRCLRQNLHQYFRNLYQMSDSISDVRYLCAMSDIQYRTSAKARGRARARARAGISDV